MVHSVTFQASKRCSVVCTLLWTKLMGGITSRRKQIKFILENMATERKVGKMESGEQDSACCQLKIHLYRLTLYTHTHARGHTQAHKRSWWLQIVDTMSLWFMIAKAESLKIMIPYTHDWFCGVCMCVYFVLRLEGWWRRDCCINFGPPTHRLHACIMSFGCWQARWTGAVTGDAPIHKHTTHYVQMPTIIII